MKHILLTISLIFGTTAVSADDHLPTAGEIVGQIPTKDFRNKTN